MVRDESRRVRRVALTGGIATGKSYVRGRFAARGIPTIDADALARDAVAPGSDGLEQVARRFGPGVLDHDGALDRKKLATIVFQDDEARRSLEAIIHPVVREMTDRWFAALDAAPHPFAVADIPLLFEGGRDRDFEKVVVVACDPPTQLRRLLDRDRLTPDDARRRIAAQWPIEQKVAKADYVVRTDGGFEDSDRSFAAVLSQLVEWSSPLPRIG